MITRKRPHSTMPSCPFYRARGGACHVTASMSAWASWGQATEVVKWPCVVLHACKGATGSRLMQQTRARRWATGWLEEKARWLYWGSRRLWYPWHCCGPGSNSDKAWKRALAQTSRCGDGYSCMQVDGTVQRYAGAAWFSGKLRLVCNPTEQGRVVHGKEKKPCGSMGWQLVLANMP